MIRKGIMIVIIAMLLFACGSFKPQENDKIPSSEYTGPYYILFEYFPEDSHVMTMGGIGDTFDLESLQQNNLNDFVESFYNHLAYAPHILNLEYGYKKKLNCLGYDITWFKKYYIADISGDLIKEHNLTLEDKSNVNFRVYRVLEDLDVKYVAEFKDCFQSSSIELNIDKIESIKKAAILLDKE